MEIQEKTKKVLKDYKVDALLLTSPANMRYLSGFQGEGYVYISKKQRLIVTDSRYTVAAKAESPDFEILCWNSKSYFSFLQEALKKDGAGSLGFEDLSMTVAEWEKLKEAVGDLDLRALGRGLSELRQVKSPEEIERIRQAEAIGDRAFSKILKKIQVGMTEKEVAAWLEFYMKEEGAEGLSFDTIAASGPHTAMPHAIPTDRRLEEGDFLTMDFGCIYQGYCSDMTRTISIGRASEELRNIYEIVARAQQTALDNITPGMTGCEIDALARDVIEEAGYGQYFGHSLGHSVGLEIHENPNFSPREEAVILPGMVVSVEPGIYVEGLGGVRIEDLVVITEDGCENLAHSPKELIEVEVN
ncbi:MAG: aminopeptidase P family protein [Eubacterium sp.]|nr:aminopeptidase P family protein [Eubacterium sp.]